MRKVKQDITIALIYNAIARTHLEYSKHELTQDSKQYATRAINRLSMNEKEALDLMNDEGREVFKSEIYKTDLLQYSHILMQLLGMGIGQRELAEKTIDAIYRGELIENKEPIY